MCMCFLRKRPGEVCLLLRAAVDSKATSFLIAVLREVALIHPDRCLRDRGCALRIERLAAEGAVQRVAVGNEPGEAMRISSERPRVHLAYPMPFRIGALRPCLLGLRTVAAAAVRAIEIGDQVRRVIVPGDASGIGLGCLRIHEPDHEGCHSKAGREHGSAYKLPPPRMSGPSCTCPGPAEPSRLSVLRFWHFRMGPLSVPVHSYLLPLGCSGERKA